MMEYDYNSFRRESDFHNKCCGGMFWCIRDICGIICAILTWLLISYAEFVVMSVILYPSPNTVYSVINTIIFQMCAFLAFASHLKTMFTDPGAVPKGNATKEMMKQMGLREGQIIFKCSKCCSIKPDRAHHCSVCQRYILPGTIIVSDGWRAYNQIGQFGGGMYEHQVVVHEGNFVNPDKEEVHTQNIENMWMRAKMKFRRQFGTSHNLFPSYLSEFVWRNQHKDTNIFAKFLIAICEQYPF